MTVQVPETLRYKGEVLTFDDYPAPDQQRSWLGKAWAQGKAGMQGNHLPLTMEKGEAYLAADMAVALSGVLRFCPLLAS